MGPYRSWGGRTGHGGVVQVMGRSYRSWWGRIGHGEGV